MVESVSVLTAEDVHLRYGQTWALVGASLELGGGEIVALTGPSGSGKTSLLYCLAGLVRPERGSVRYGGSVLGGLDDEALSALRRTHFGFVFQFGELIPELSLEENVALPLRLLGMRRSAARNKARSLLRDLGLEREAERRPTQVSGGQAQRAAVARALIHSPRVVFADEPTGSLDSENTQLVLQEFIDLARSSGTAVVLVTHEADVADVADRQVNMADGAVTGGLVSS